MRTDVDFRDTETCRIYMENTSNDAVKVIDAVFNSGVLLHRDSPAFTMTTAVLAVINAALLKRLELGYPLTNTTEYKEDFERAMRIVLKDGFNERIDPSEIQTVDDIYSVIEQQLDLATQSTDDEAETLSRSFVASLFVGLAITKDTAERPSEEWTKELFELAVKVVGDFSSLLVHMLEMHLKNKDHE